jgi:hypothetical protein
MMISKKSARKHVEDINHNKEKVNIAPSWSYDTDILMPQLNKILKLVQNVKIANYVPILILLAYTYGGLST